MLVFNHATVSGYKDAKAVFRHKWVLVVPTFYRPQMKFAKVVFSQVSVCPRGSLSRGRVVSVWGISVKGGLCQGGIYLGVSLLGRPSRHRPPYSNERAVCILLECILVNIAVNYFDAKQYARCSWVLIVTELVVTGTQYLLLIRSGSL